jgi:endonuclease/exonuclease/phosphatase family metal-dependent hydrolase
MGIGNGYKDYVRCNKKIALNKKYLDNIAKFLKSKKPDIVCLVEADSGSIRSQGTNQAEYIKEKLGFKSLANYCKYGKHSLISKLPYFRHLDNAVLSKYPFTKIVEHDLKRGVKKVVIEVVINNRLTLFLVHLPLARSARRNQLKQIAHIVEYSHHPKLVLGDFNTLKGDSELDAFLSSTRMKLVSHNMKTFPSWKPKKCLDHVIYSHNIKIKKVFVPKVHFSDHLPIIIDFEVR